LPCEGLSEAEWALIAPLLPAERGRVGRPSHDNRRVLNGILWTVRSGARWTDVPERYGRWNSVYRRFRRWAQAGVFEALLEALAGALAQERLQMIDSTIVRAHAHAAGAKKGNADQALGRSRGGLSTKIHIRADAKGRPLAFTLTGGEAHDITGIDELLAGWDRLPRCLLADKGYDADRLREDLLLSGVNPIIPFKSNRQERWSLDRALYRERNWIERIIGRLKQFRRVATRYDKTACAYLATLHLAAIRIWLRSAGRAEGVPCSRRAQGRAGA
jgi:transposase